MRRQGRYMLRLMGSLLLLLSMFVFLRIRPYLNDKYEYIFNIGLFSSIGLIALLGSLLWLCSYRRTRNELVINVSIFLWVSLYMFIILEIITRIYENKIAMDLETIGLAIILLLALYGVVSYGFSRHIRRRNMRIANFIIITIIIIIPAYMLLSRGTQNPAQEITRDESGNIRWNKSFFVEDQMVYMYDLTLDEKERRIVDQEVRDEDERQNDSIDVILLGCSYTFGDGLRDEDTLQYKLGEELDDDYHIINYGWPGKGPHTIYNMMIEGKRTMHLFEETDDIFSDIRKDDSNIFIYNLIPELHTRRVVSPGRDRIRQDPWIDIEDQEITYLGSFLEQGFYVYIRMNVEVLSEWSYLIGLINPFKTIPEDEDIALASKIIEQMKYEINNNLGGELHVVINKLGDDNNIGENFSDILEDMNISHNTFDPNIDEDRLRIMGEGHPNGKHNELLAELLAEDIFLER